MVVVKPLPVGCILTRHDQKLLVQKGFICYLFNVDMCSLGPDLGTAWYKCVEVDELGLRS